ncbi:phosphoenolpyruvate carboxylase [Calycomorphotria hydatis]|uniref:Phosphoenolpyruvate carboxylase n=1 Tax=Calycomorphotria hydatis TaxID=2528027 RepID=A0A517T8C3_9PLAN|nr:phosphoenolpyruvate carboxylase [Calycomorphotria hydatis]QDT64640.1 Phosphoenolpyruvate carboxylase [Calycomorphotria hydatis]
MTTTLTDNELHDDIRLLAELLESTIAEQEGEDRLAMVNEIHQLAIDRREKVPGAEDALIDRIAKMTPEEFSVAIPALSVFFDLANTAEDTHRVRVLRERTREAGNSPRPESLRSAVYALKEKGLSVDEVAERLSGLCVDLVFTAHPTEAKRRTTRRLIRKVRTGLQQLHSEQLLERERDRVREKLSSDLTILWQIDQTRPQRPTVMQEVERGLFFVKELWQVIPDIHRELRRAIKEAFGKTDWETPVFLKFGSWIGGDRDGNPFVTADVTRNTLSVLRTAAIQRQRESAHELYRMLVISDRKAKLPQSIRLAVSEAYDRWPSIRPILDQISPNEIYRRWIRVIEYRLEQSLEAEVADRTRRAAYGSAEELERDVRLIEEGLREHGGDRVADVYLADWLVLIRTFGLHYASLDVRQDSRVHVEVLTNIFKQTGLCDDYSALNEKERQDILKKTLDEQPKFFVSDFEDMTRETLALFRLIADTVRSSGMEPIGGHVISMTHTASDMLTILWLWKWAWTSTDETQGEPLPQLPIVPLFETIEDLNNGADVLNELLIDPVYEPYIRRDGKAQQMVMVGYSDSTKDGGYLAAGWGLHAAQRRLADVTQKHDVELVVFHGRGGGLGRGGGPAARAILSLPPNSVGGHLRMTEQGEVLAERYDDPQIAHRHLEQVSWATLLVSSQDETNLDPKWVELMESLNDSSFKTYRQLVEHKGFLTYFDRATPISEIENFPIGSRPSRRRERKSLSDLRAIPWTFSWTQSRQMLPAWYGLGSSLGEVIDKDGPETFQEMYAKWPMFRALIDNAELALMKADMGIARRYVELIPEGDTAWEVWSLVENEFANSRDAILAITGHDELLGGIPWLRDSIHERNPYVDPLNLIQIELIRRLRALDAEQSEANEQKIHELRELCRLSIQGIAGGLRTTG